MAVTSLWHVKGSIKDVIDYIKNPEKTVPNQDLQDFFDVFSYVKNPLKTNEGGCVSAVNCLKETALQQMILTKKQYQKTGGYIAWHGFQSFKPDEVTPEQCHEIGLKLAREMWGGKCQIIVATHLDKEHLHNHFCFNSVSFINGQKYNYSKSEQNRLREVSDRLCREYGLSVIENPKKAPVRPLYLDEKSGKPTRYNVYREDLNEAINGSRDLRHMMKYLADKGKPTSPLMKEELRKLDEITAQVRYMSKHNISTLSDLQVDREKNQTEMNKLIDSRQHLRNKVCRATPAEKETLRAKKQGVTEQITELRKRLKYADGIEKRSAHIDGCLNQIHDTIENQRPNRQKEPVRTDRRREGFLR